MKLLQPLTCRSANAPASAAPRASASTGARSRDDERASAEAQAARSSAELAAKLESTGALGAVMSLCGLIQPVLMIVGSLAAYEGAGVDAPVTVMTDGDGGPAAVIRAAVAGSWGRAPKGTFRLGNGRSYCIG